jgi:predicted transcriptional regulator
MGQPGRPPFQPTDHDHRTVETLVGHGVAAHVIARVVGIDEKTLRKHFREELHHGRAMLAARMGVVIVRAGLAGDWRAAAYWLARFGGPQWRLPKPVVVTGAVATYESEVAKMSIEEIRAELAALEKVETAPVVARH